MGKNITFGTLIIILSILINKKNILIYSFIIFLIKTNIYIKDFSIFPKISIYMPIYNKSQYLMKSISSIQRQSLKDIEIIAINDCSTDNSLDILNKLSKNDTRIKVLNNDKNHGLLYSRAMGILNTTGEFLMNLDPDDLFQGEDDLEYLYNITKKLKVDIISFAYLQNNKYNLKCPNYNKIIRQPKLFESSFDIFNTVVDDVLWNKLVKKKLMLKIYELFKQKIFSVKWNYGEDTIWSILMNKYSRSKMCVNKVIYRYNSNNDSLTHLRENFTELQNKIYIDEMYREIFKEKNELKYIIAHLLVLIEELNKPHLIILLKNNNEIKLKLKNLLRICINKYKCSNNIIKNLIKLINI